MKLSTKVASLVAVGMLLVGFNREYVDNIGYINEGFDVLQNELSEIAGELSEFTEEQLGDGENSILQKVKNMMESIDSANVDTKEITDTLNTIIDDYDLRDDMNPTCDDKYEGTEVEEFDDGNGALYRVVFPTE